MLVFGDLMQLPPVNGHWCFERPAWCEAEEHLWHQFRLCELTVNMRQRDDSEFINILNNLRVGQLTTNQLELLIERKQVPKTGQFADGVAVRIYPTIKQVDTYNSMMTEIIATRSHLYTISAVDESRESATYGRTPPASAAPADPNKCGGLVQTIELAVGSRIMLRRNISITDGLVNGAMGVLKGFKWPALRRDQLEPGELPDAILILFDDPSIRSTS